MAWNSLCVCILITDLKYWKFIAAAYSQITCKLIHLSFIQYGLLIFTNLLQSPLKGIARGTQNFLGGSRPIPAPNWPSDSRENHEKFIKPCSRGWTTPKSPKDSGPGSLRASLSCWWTPGCGTESIVGSFLSHVNAPSLAGRSKVLPQRALGPMATVHLPRCRSAMSSHPRMNE